jgi:hypothetical protein
MINIRKFEKAAICLLILVISLASCKKDDPEPVQQYDEDKGVFICNEGNFTYGNGSLSFYDTENGVVSNQIFYNANNFPLGDVVFSMSIFDNKGYVVVNNSGKIVVMNIDDFTHIATITGLSSPRHIEYINSEKAYVTDLYSPYITIFSPGTYTITGSIFVGKGTEQTTRVGDYVYVTSWSYNNQVYKINCTNDVLTDSITVAKQPNSIVKDKYNRLWVLSDGGFQGSPYGQDTAALTCINTNTFEIEKELRFPSLETSPSKLCINHSRDTLFYLNGSWGGGIGNESGVYKMCVDDLSLPSTALIPEVTRLFYGLGVSPYDSKIYVSDAIDYVQKGWVYHYTPNGAIIDSFKVDIIPGAFCFK